MVHKILSKFSSLLGNSSDKPEQAHPNPPPDNGRDREKQLMSKMEVILDEIQYNPHIRLPKEKIKEFKIEQRIASVRRILEKPLIDKIDTAELHNLVLSFVDFLKLTLEQGYEYGAYWSSTALMKTAETLRIGNIDLYTRDPDMEKALYIQKLHCAKTFYDLVQSAIELDRQEQQMATLEADYNSQAQELRDRKTAHRALTKTEAGMKLIASANAKRTNHASMTDQERAVLDNEMRIISLQNQIRSSYVIWETLDTEMHCLLQQIEMIHRQLSVDPEVPDEKLSAKVREAGEYFRQELSSQQRMFFSRIEYIDIDPGSMLQLLKHPAVSDKVAKLVQALDEEEHSWATRIRQELISHSAAFQKRHTAFMAEQQED